MICVVGAVCDPGDQSSGSSGHKAQKVGPCGAVRTTVPVTLLVTPCSWRLLCVCKVPSAISGVVQACFHGDSLLGALSAEIAALALL